jgi:hypothetical protein
MSQQPFLRHHFPFSPVILRLVRPSHHPSAVVAPADEGHQFNDPLGREWRYNGYWTAMFGNGLILIRQT